MLGAFQDVEDNLAALRILETEAREQHEAVQAAERSLTLTTNQYRAGTVSYLNVVVAQTAALTSEQTAVGITGRRLGASVLLIKALGGGWSADRLPTDREVTRLLGRGMARRLDETHPNLTLADQNRQERGRRRLGESKTPSDLGGCGKPDLLDTGQQLVLELGPPVCHSATSLSCCRSDLVTGQM